MAIIVEMKTCCRKQNLDEGVIDSIVGLFNSESGVAGEIRSRMAEYIAEAFLSYLFGEASPAVKRTIFYKTIKKSIAALDSEDYVALLRGKSGKRPVCEKLSTAVIAGLLKVINDELTDEINSLTKRFGGDNQLFNAIRDSLGGVEKFIVGSAVEDLKSGGTLDQISDQICSIDFTSLIKKQFGDMFSGVGSLVKDLNPFDE